MNEEIQIDLSFLEDLGEPPTLEEELSVEKDILRLKATKNINQIKEYSESLIRQNHAQSHFISNCLGKMAELQGQLAKYRIEETKGKQQLTKNEMKGIWNKFMNKKN